MLFLPAQVWSIADTSTNERGRDTCVFHVKSFVDIAQGCIFRAVLRREGKSHTTRQAAITKRIFVVAKFMRTATIRPPQFCRVRASVRNGVRKNVRFSNVRKNVRFSDVRFTRTRWRFGPAPSSCPTPKRVAHYAADDASDMTLNAPCTGWVTAPGPCAAWRVLRWSHCRQSGRSLGWKTGHL